ncbi:MAG: hypothetical protein QXT68_03665 [Halobacteria archaeon]
MEAAAVHLTAHAVARFAERHAREVQVGSRFGVTEKIQREVRRGTFWRDRDGSLLCVYNNLRVYVCLEGPFRVVTEFPYTQGFKRRLAGMERIPNPARSFK